MIAQGIEYQRIGPLLRLLRTDDPWKPLFKPSFHLPMFHALSDDYYNAGLVVIWAPKP